MNSLLLFLIIYFFNQSLPTKTYMSYLWNGFDFQKGSSQLKEDGVSLIQWEDAQELGDFCAKPGSAAS